MQQLIWSDPFYEADVESGKGAKRANALPTHGPVGSRWWWHVHSLINSNYKACGVLATWGTVIIRSDRDPWPCGAYILKVQETSNTSNKRIKYTLCIISVCKRGKRRRKVLSPPRWYNRNKDRGEEMIMQVPGLYLAERMLSAKMLQQKEAQKVPEGIARVTYTTREKWVTPPVWRRKSKQV